MGLLVMTESLRLVNCVVCSDKAFVKSLTKEVAVAVAVVKDEEEEEEEVAAGVRVLERRAADLATDLDEIATVIFGGGIPDFFCFLADDTIFAEVAPAPRLRD